MHGRLSDALAHATAGSYLGLGCLGLAGQDASLTQGDLATVLELELLVLGLDGHAHVVDYDTFFALREVLETGWPPLEGLEAEGEAVLPRCHAPAAVDHRVALGEQVPRLEVHHLEMPVRGRPDILGPVVVAAVVVGFHVRNLDTL